MQSLSNDYPCDVALWRTDTQSSSLLGWSAFGGQEHLATYDVSHYTWVAGRKVGVSGWEITNCSHSCSLRPRSVQSINWLVCSDK